MANHKSALKRTRQSLNRRNLNRASRNTMKTLIRALDVAVEDNSADKAQAALRLVIPVIHKTAVKGVIHKRNASRKVSRLTKRVNALVASQQAAA